MSEMTAGERDSFLAEPRVAVLGIARRAGGPLLAPIWYRYVGGQFLLCMSGSSAKARCLNSARRATVCVQADDFPYRYVTAEGTVSMQLLGVATHETIRVLASRYLGENGGTNYADHFAAIDEVLVTVTPARWMSEVPGR